MQKSHSHQKCTKISAFAQWYDYAQLCQLLLIICITKLSSRHTFQISRWSLVCENKIFASESPSLQRLTFCYCFQITELTVSQQSAGINMECFCKELYQLLRIRDKPFCSSEIWGFGWVRPSRKLSSFYETLVRTSITLCLIQTVYGVGLWSYLQLLLWQ